MSEHLDRWVSANIRNEIEQRFYAKISEQADFNQLARNPEFMNAPDKHVGLFADHGIVHARDVANQVLMVLANCHEVLIPRRHAQRFAFMQGYGVLLAYLHDIGMVDFSSFGRLMHPEFAAQAVFDPALDAVIDRIWHENSGGLAWRLRTLSDQGHLVQEPEMVLRELLSLSVCHSKSKIPITLLNDPRRLREKMITIITSDLEALYANQEPKKGQSTTTVPADQAAATRPNAKIERYAHIFPERAFCWLIDDHPSLHYLVEDVIDTLRSLRAADALRQRGTVLVTSASYQIFVDQGKGNAIYSLRLGEDQLYLLELPGPISAGEANIASSELEPSGDLRISFHHGSFSKPEAVAHAAQSAAMVIHDIQQDVIMSFVRAANAPDLKPAAAMRILLEETDDNSAFPLEVRASLKQIDPDVADNVRITPSLKHADPLERDRYLASDPLDWNRQIRLDLLAQIGRTGFPVERVDIQRAFKDVRLAKLDVGDVLLEARAPSAFVYLPMGPGLKIIPIGGYKAFSVQPWMFLGMVGVVRDAERSATIVAERQLQVLIIPKTAYLTYWHHTLSLEEFRKAVNAAVKDSMPDQGTLSLLEKSILLRGVPFFKALDQERLMDLACCVTEVEVAAGEMLFVKGAIGRSLYVVVKGSLQVHDEDVILAELGSSDFFGELAAVSPAPRSASVTALEASKLLCLDQKDLNDLLDSDTAVARGVIEALTGYLRRQNVTIAETQKEFPSPEG